MPVIVPIARDGPVGVPLDYTVPIGTEIVPLCVTATFDGSSAGSAFVPTLEIVSPAGMVVAECPVVPSVAAGGSATVCWFPGIGGGISQAKVAFVGARIATNASQTIAAGTPTDLRYEVVDFDTGGFANLGADNRILTAPTSGLYLVSCYTAWTYNNRGDRTSGVVYNGFAGSGASFASNDQVMPVWAPINDPHVNGSPHTSTQSSELIRANAGDFFSSGGVQNSGGNLACNDPPNGSGYLSAVLIGA